MDDKNVIQGPWEKPEEIVEESPKFNITPLMLRIIVLLAIFITSLFIL